MVEHIKEHPLTRKARRLAVVAHGEQNYGPHPYERHLMQVVRNVWRFWEGDEELLPTLECSAWLHDTLEDTAVDVSTVRERFGDTIADIVELVTDAAGEDQEQRHRNTYPLMRANALAVFVKLCDRIANVEASLDTKPDSMSKYGREYPYFRDTLHRPGEYDRVWRYLDFLFADAPSLPSGEWGIVGS
jgi:(p)ppGpp synthase/HD superfamily hydrolase